MPHIQSTDFTMFYWLPVIQCQEYLALQGRLEGAIFGWSIGRARAGEALGHFSLMGLADHQMQFEDFIGNWFGLKAVWQRICRFHVVTDG